ncbi:DUF1236 domain-containing protein [Phyllobacterium salinisoli]|uniref:DUF1236 domain-containing protein n=1 Tax=Phyllobacterium salinisoli TaxID=1899321 RepID=A0A368K6Z4_9HYPH|nr:DUF1236 domain-containing protein [Phyllobacterium salinisoli]RCS24142.1 DUF1236 domain-containing protein [Phyllobacterium salinisoli]
MMKTPVALSAALIFAGVTVGTGSAFAQDMVITEVPPPVREYVIQHPVDPVVIEGDVVEGYVIPQDIELRPVPDMPQYGYIYVNGQPVIVSLENRKVIYLGE